MSPSKALILSALLSFGVVSVCAQQAPDPSSTLAALEQTARTSVSDISHLRVEKWKIDSNSKKTAQSDSDSIQRNMGSALPELIVKVRSAPEDLNANFKLYRNLNVLYDVFSRFTETAGAFGSRDEFQALARDLDGLETARRAMADRIEALTSSAQAELTQYRAQAHAAQATTPAAPPKKIVIDDSEPEKKAVKKKKPAPAKPTAAPDAGNTAAPTPK